MDMKKTTLTAAMSIALGGAAFGAQASLTSGDALTFVLGTAQTGLRCAIGGTFPSNCKYGAASGSDIVGSYFSMDTNGDGATQLAEKTPIGSFNGIIIGAIQPAGFSHFGGVNGTEAPNIDAPWEFFGSTGMHQTSAAIAVVSDFGSVIHLDMSGWNLTWSGISSIPLTQIGVGIVSCDTSCGDGEGYVLDASFQVGEFQFGGIGFTTTPYALHLEGTLDGDPPPPPPSVNVDIAGGISQECDVEGGNNVSLSADVFTPVPDDVAAITWFLDDEPVGEGAALDVFVPLGLHTVKVVLDTTQSGTADDSEDIFIKDTMAPDIMLGFVHHKTGEELTSVTLGKGEEKVGILTAATDICDPSPSVDSTVGVPTEKDDVVLLNSVKKKSSVVLSSPSAQDSLDLSVQAEDASGNRSSRTKTIDINR